MISHLFAAVLLQAATDPLIENALQVSGPEGEYVVYFEADGSYSTNVGISGNWHMEGDQFCVARATGEANCQPLMDDLSVGDSWTGQNANGDDVTFTLVARD
ncbi:hypothetical protein V0U79_09525 [Hyphobacterium sp. HN65]|uniref:Uncharacterized protein n=1 Tax=Hyphobacterium lacteum TaxID=3116575 RepID=A0ABU7LSI5_9PROT|nr:hypothetical protein [Hyphobacterium sp. HN65]MEE2526606.1 hypothetical protein [Hyphobacterium sp. HN65]